MASKIATILALTSEQEEAIERSTGKLQSVAEWMSETIEALKEGPIVRLLGEAGEIAKEWSGAAKAVGKLMETITAEHSPETLGWAACTIAYNNAAGRAIHLFGAPRSHLPYSGEIWRERLRRLPLEDPAVMKGFSLRSALAHPFTRAADQALLIALDAAGYDSSERRKILRNVRASFSHELATLLTAERMEHFAGFTQWLQLEPAFVDSNFRARPRWDLRLDCWFGNTGPDRWPRSGCNCTIRGPT